MQIVSELKKVIDSGEVDALKIFMRQNDLILEGNKIVAKDKTYAKTREAFWDSRQQARKILLNSLPSRG